MSAPVQSAAGFRAEREGDWLRLQAMLDRIERRSVRVLADDELLALPVLYRAALSSLSVARATSLDQAMIGYLEALCLRGYLVVYGARGGIAGRLRRFLAADWPAAVRALWPETLAALALLLAGALAGDVLVASDPGWFHAIVPAQIGDVRDPAASAATLRAVLYQGDRADMLSLFATFLFTHNAQIAILAFALGFAFGVPTVMLIAFNGCMLGAMLEIYVARGLGLELGGWLAIHGTTELFATVLAGAAGLHIGRRTAFPGAEPRLIAAARGGRTAAVAMAGVVVMLLVAALLEGIGRQTILGEAWRYAIGTGALAGWLAFFYLAGPRRHG